MSGQILSSGEEEVSRKCGDCSEELTVVEVVMLPEGELAVAGCDLTSSPGRSHGHHATQAPPTQWL
jgi:hypothetical protein